MFFGLAHGKEVWGWISYYFTLTPAFEQAVVSPSLAARSREDSELQCHLLKDTLHTMEGCYDDRKKQLKQLFKNLPAQQKA
ncbi:hypothetical protein AV530_018040 [Patagioenas fasciata monilis]|uniref:Uncharacterized protein n=1 Tax=Patagioenas fasciata monilis TaxID=372326 RepID=A0A1V4KKP4_PATFA|nr:hypothetical protein AV530_018040 [Patagioenas fasciata monilis]